MQNYDPIDAYQRWEGRLEEFIATMRGNYESQKPFPSLANFTDEGELSVSSRWKVVRHGKVVWGVFARAFWPIYERGRNNHYGTVLCGTSPAALDRGAFLFELSHSLRVLREQGGESEEHSKFAKMIRDDQMMLSRLHVPKGLTGGRNIFFQNICIHRKNLPEGYLHHRLVPVITHETIPYATILPMRYWSEVFCEIWQTGEPLLDEQALSEYHAHWPGLVS